jgi:D-sedoheptulose 7-phosphate isomerase
VNNSSHTVKIQRAINTFQAWLEDDVQVVRFEKFIDEVFGSLKRGNKVIFFGNGGSAAEATHLAAEFTGKCVHDIGPLPALSLNDSVSALTAISNDWTFEKVFARQVQALVRTGDVVIGLSTSGASANVIAGLEEAQRMGAVTSLWSSKQLKDLSKIDFSYIFQAPTNSTPRAQELHLLIGHILAEEIELRWES